MSNRASTSGRVASVGLVLAVVALVNLAVAPPISATIPTGGSIMTGIPGWTGMGCYAQATSNPCASWVYGNPNTDSSDSGGCYIGCGGSGAGTSDSPPVIGQLGITGFAHGTKVVANFSYQVKDIHGNSVYIVTYLYTSPNGNTLYARSDVHVSSGSGWVLAGYYPGWSIYSCICWGTPLTAGNVLYYPESNSSSFVEYVPTNTVNSGSSGTWGASISASVSLWGAGPQVGGDISWTQNLPQYSENPYVQTSNEAYWTFTDYDGNNGNAPTAAGFTGGTAQAVVHNHYNWVYWEGWGTFETFDTGCPCDEFLNVMGYGYIYVYLS